MKNRLIELLQGADKECEAIRQCENCVGFGKGSECINYHIATYLLNNSVIVPPCKVGQTVWFVRNLGDKSREKVIETTIEKIVLKSNGLFIKLACNAMYETACNSIGKTVFLTREEAEQALAKTKGGAEE